MSTRKPKPGVTRLGRFVRRWRFDRNPLRRATDRVETAVLAVLVAAFLIGAPFAALASGAWVHGMARQAQLTQEASRRQVTAVVLTVAVPSAVGEQLAWQAQARWRAPDGREVIHEVPVPAGTAVGGKLQVWTDRTGDFITAPLLDSQVADHTTSGEVLGVIAAASVLTVAGVLALWTINKRRMAAWDADWHATGPRWTTRA
jgi:ABC-type multidrug transport system fused ATPase/permease subunit